MMKGPEIKNGGTPTLQGPGGEAHEILYQVQPNDPPAWNLSVAGWIVVSERYHPFWRAWFVGAASLKGWPGVRPAIKHYPEAEHEFVIVSLDPKVPLDLAQRPPALAMLEPVDLAMQVDGVSREQVSQIVRSIVEEVVLNGLSPDQDFRMRWVQHIRTIVNRFTGRSNWGSATGQAAGHA